MTSSIWRVGAGEQVAARRPARRAPGQGDVDPVVGEPRLQLARVELAARASSSASSSLRALLAPPSDRPRSSAGRSAIPRRIVVSSALRPR